MNDYQKFLNPQALLALYGDFSPLDDSEVFEVLLKRDEPRVSIKLMTKKKPKNPPDRWSQDYDAIYLGISFIGVQKITANDWGHSNTVGQFSIENSVDRASVRMSCKENFSITFDCDWISIDSLIPGNVGTQ